MSYYSYDRRGGFLPGLPVVTKNILITNVLILIISELAPGFMTRTFALFYPSSPFFHWWQIVTHMFMHGGLMHLFANMFTFVIFGAVLERQWGPRKYLIFYFITGLGAAALHMGVMALQVASHMDAIALGGQEAIQAIQQINAIKSTPMVGASGAIYGVLIGFAMLFPEERIMLLFPPVSLKAKTMIVIWLVIELAAGVGSAGGGIAHFAHLGGMLFGWLLIRHWKRQGRMYDYEN